MSHTVKENRVLLRPTVHCEEESEAMPRRVECGLALRLRFATWRR